MVFRDHDSVKLTRWTARRTAHRHRIRPVCVNMIVRPSAGTACCCNVAYHFFSVGEPQPLLPTRTNSAKPFGVCGGKRMAGDGAQFDFHGPPGPR